MCKECLGIGHCVAKDDTFYALAKATICNSFINIAENRDHLERSNIDFRQEKKEKAYKAKTSSRMNVMIYEMYNDGSTLEELIPIINLAQALDDDSDNGYESSNSATSDDMWNGQVEVNKDHKTTELKPSPPPNHSGNTITIKP